MDEHEERRLSQKLDDAVIRSTVTRAGLFLAAFELLRYDVVDGVKGFFMSGFDAGGYTYAPEYDSEVLSLEYNVYDASARWLASASAVSEEEADELIAIRKHRNEVAHELPNLLIDTQSHFSTDLLQRCRFFVDKLGRFWGTVEVDTDPSIDQARVDYAGTRSMRSLLLEHIWKAVNEPAI